MECLLCLESVNKPNCMQVGSLQWQQFSVQKIIEKYLWCMEPLTTTSYVCCPCWEELNDFHKFYTRIEGAHKENKVLIKTELNDIEESNGNELFLFEPEITIAQGFDTTRDIKQEVKELDNEYGDNSDDILNVDHDYLEEGSDDDTNSDGFVSSDSDTCDKSSIIIRSKKSSSIDKNKSEKSKNNNNANRNSFQLSKSKKLNYDEFLKKHIQMTCNKCELTFDRFRLLSQHCKNEHNEQGFVTCCEFKFFSRYLLVDHINYHLDPEYFKCSYCKKVFKRRRCLQVHIKVHEDRKHACDVCDRNFSRKYMLDTHKLTHLPQSEKKFPCNECGKFYATEYVLTQHQRAVHLGVYARVCDVCGQTLPDAISFKHHMEKHDPTASPIKCNDCGLLLTSQVTLKKHKMLKHPEGESREYKCHICTKVSPTMRALKKHIHETHEMGYKHKCTVCEKEFKRLDNFKSHMAMHTGTPLYRCPWCPKEFNSNGNMHQHRKKAHPLEWEEAQRKKYSGNLPPNYKRHSTYNSQPIDTNQE